MRPGRGAAGRRWMPRGGRGRQPARPSSLRLPSLSLSLPLSETNKNIFKKEEAGLPCALPRSRARGAGSWRSSSVCKGHRLGRRSCGYAVPAWAPAEARAMRRRGPHLPSGWGPPAQGTRPGDPSSEPPAGEPRAAARRRRGETAQAPAGSAPTCVRLRARRRKGRGRAAPARCAARGAGAGRPSADCGGGGGGLAATTVGGVAGSGGRAAGVSVLGGRGAAGGHHGDHRQHAARAGKARRRRALLRRGRRGALRASGPRAGRRGRSGRGGPGGRVVRLEEAPAPRRGPGGAASGSRSRPPGRERPRVWAPVGRTPAGWRLGRAGSQPGRRRPREPAWPRGRRARAAPSAQPRGAAPGLATWAAGTPRRSLPTGERPFPRARFRAGAEPRGPRRAFRFPCPDPRLPRGGPRAVPAAALVAPSPSPPPPRELAQPTPAGPCVQAGHRRVARLRVAACGSRAGGSRVLTQSRAAGAQGPPALGWGLRGPRPGEPALEG